MAWRKPVAKITDRAKRYRANHDDVRPPLECCVYCGRGGGRLDVEHIDGDESNGAPANLAASCRSCNVRKGHVLASWGLAKPTRQYNPAGGLKTLAQYRAVVDVLQGRRYGDVRAAVRKLQRTSQARRISFGRALGARLNPRGKGMSFGQWGAAIASYDALTHGRPGAQMELFEARPILAKARDEGKVSRFQRRVWEIRKERYGPSGRKDAPTGRRRRRRDDDVPF